MGSWEPHGKSTPDAAQIENGNNRKRCCRTISNPMYKHHKTVRLPRNGNGLPLFVLLYDRPQVTVSLKLILYIISNKLSTPTRLIEKDYMLPLVLTSKCQKCGCVTQSIVCFYIKLGPIPLSWFFLVKVCEENDMSCKVVV